MLHPRYIRISFHSDQKVELREYFKKIGDDEHTYSQISEQYTELVNAINCEAHDFDEEFAFSEEALSKVPFVW